LYNVSAKDASLSVPFLIEMCFTNDSCVKISMNIWHERNKNTSVTVYCNLYYKDVNSNLGLILVTLPYTFLILLDPPLPVHSRASRGLRMQMAINLFVLLSVWSLS